MPKVVTVVITDRIRFKAKYMPKSVVERRYIVELYNETACEKCDNLPERHNDLCDECPNFEGRYKFFSSKDFKERGLWSLPQGDELWIEDYLTKLTRKNGWVLDWRDRRKVIPFDNAIKFTGKLYGPNDTNEDGTPKANQKKVVSKWLAAETGVIRARPRTGKTVMATYLYTKLGVKTVIIAHQKDLLVQFYETATGHKPPKFRGNKRIADGEKALKRRAVTNIYQLQKKTGKEIIRMINNFSVLEKAKEDYDIILVTYQSFIRDPQRVLKYLNNRYSLCVVDEQHQGSADGYLRMLASLDIKHRLSLSATTDRKDQRHRFGRLVLGPIVASSGAHALKPTVSFKRSGFKCDLKTWAGVTKRRVNDANYIKMLTREVFKDLRSGHNGIIIPMRSKVMQMRLVNKINKQAKINYEKRNEDWPIALATAFNANSDRDTVLDWVDNPTWDVDPPKGVKRKPGPAPRVLVGIEKMVKQGIDFANPTMLYVVEPMSAKRTVGAPMFDQLSNRVCTAVPGKRQPHIKIFVDDVNMFKGSFTGLLWNEIFPKSNIKNGHDTKKVQYIMTKADFEAAKLILELAKKKKDANEWAWNRGW